MVYIIQSKILKFSSERDKKMFKSNFTNQVLRIAGLWAVYFIILFTSDFFSYSQNKTFFVIVTALYILLTLFFLWRIKNPSKKARYHENGQRSI